MESFWRRFQTAMAATAVAELGEVELAREILREAEGGATDPEEGRPHRPRLRVLSTPPAHASR